LIIKLAKQGLPLNKASVPLGVKTSPHPLGVGVLVDYDALMASFDVELMPEARYLADLYKLFLCGNPIGQAGAMGGIIPEKLLWQTIDTASKRLKVKLSRWAIELLFNVDAIRLNCEFKKLKEQADNRPK
jgi:hypothetical protein